MENHEYYMQMALKLSLKAKGLTSPNPMVGAVVVNKGKVVGKGYHQKAGLPHAETAALDQAGEKARGGILYVTLEPCAHYGRTPPCVNRVINSGVKEVVVGVIDPNPLTNGKGVQILRDCKIKVSVGHCEPEIRAANKPFFKYITTGLPFVTVKTAQSLDGKIATRTGDSKWITSDKARNFSHRIRQNYDAVMVGVNTVLRDNPRLEAWEAKRQPAKIIVDSKLSTPHTAALFNGKNKVLLVTLPVLAGQETENRKILSSRGCILEIKEKNGQVNLKDMMKKLARLEISSILVEGGGTLVGSLFDEGLVDKVLFFINPRIIGGSEATSSVMGRGAGRLEQSIKLKNISMRRIGEDFLFEGDVR